MTGLEALAVILLIIGAAAFIAWLGYGMYLLVKAIADNYKEKIEDAERMPDEPDEQHLTWYQKPTHYVGTFPIA